MASSARDDAAGLAISSRLRADIASQRTYVTNAQQATSILQIAEGAYQRTNDMLVRMRGLASQAQSSNLSKTERGMLDTEFQQLKTEITRIAGNTAFNGTNLFGIGAVQFSTSDYYSTAGIQSTNTGDFNGDGISDIIYSTGAATFIRYSNLDGVLGTAVQVAAFGGSDIKIGDFNGDGRSDFIVSSGRVFVNNGNGSFTNTATVASYTALSVVADINNDGVDDVTFGVANSIRVNYMSRSGTVASTTSTVVSGSSATVFSAGDMNNDGILDLVFTNDLAEFGTLLNNGQGALTVSSYFATSQGYYYASNTQMFDWNNDGNLDVFSTDGGGTAYWYYGDGKGNFTQSNSIGLDVNGDIWRDSIAGDFNGDGFYDFAIINFDAQEVHIYSGNGINSVDTANPQIISGTFFDKLNIGDVNRDGRMDLVNTGFGGINVIKNISTIGMSDNVRVSSNSSAASNVGFQIRSISLNALDQDLQYSNVNSLGGAKRAEQSLIRALNQLVISRTGVGAAINRLDKVQDNLANQIENLDNARSSYADLNVATEMIKYVAEQIKVQAGISMLSQASSSQKLVAKLIE